MTQRIQVIGDYYGSISEPAKAVRELLECSKGYVRIENHVPVMDIYPESPNQADNVIGLLEREYPDLSLVYE